MDRPQERVERARRARNLKELKTFFRSNGKSFKQGLKEAQLLQKEFKTVIIDKVGAIRYYLCILSKLLVSYCYYEHLKDDIKAMCHPKTTMCIKDVISRSFPIVSARTSD